MSKFTLPDLQVPDSMARETMPDLLRHWYLGPPARRHMMLRRFLEVDRELCGRPAEWVLDIGSAWGYNPMALEALGYRSFGMDLVTDQFEAGQEIADANGVEFRVVGANAAALPFPDETFHYITLVETFEHIYLDDRPVALAECFRVLRPGGKVVLSTPNFHSIVERAKRLAVGQRWIREKLPTMCYPEEGTSRDEYHPYRYHHPLPDKRIESLIREAGFQHLNTRHFLFMLKSTPDATFGFSRFLEAVAEGIPGIRSLAATSCFVAQKPDFQG
jgi:ubiquinone/menaquinone biosynthesis C-methylase UbiE